MDLRLPGVESEPAWLEMVHALVELKLGAPVLAVIDGNPGLAVALSARWPKLARQLVTLSLGLQYSPTRRPIGYSCGLWHGGTKV